MTRPCKTLLLQAAIIMLVSLSPHARSQAPACPASASHIRIDNGEYSSQPGVTFQLRHFVATLVPMGKKAPLCYQKLTVVSRAQIFVSNESLTRVFQEKLGGTGGQIKDFKVQNGDGKVTLNGKITKLVPVQFTIEGPVTTDGTMILVRANKINADGIPVKALLQMVGEHLSSILNVKNVKGITIDENTIAFSPEQIAHLKGYIEAVEPTVEGLTLRYGANPSHHASGSHSASSTSK